ncbi:MAG TPA: hypothetical protein VLJ39_08785 [Tepidisphaeraceae bacterium]|jgi:hypothetical protein|nr:hypothetical protein [Tepidisphaeraceae bacterium]
MNHHDAEITDVVVVLDNHGLQEIDSCVGSLKSVGMEVVDVNKDEGVVEGNIEADKVHHLKTVTGVSYVRSVFTYVADFPAGDPRDKDGPEDTTNEDD